MLVKRYGKLEAHLDRAELTQQGFRQGVVPISKIGVFAYRNKDGTTRWEARLPQHVLTKKAVDSFKCKPIQIDHPEMLDNPDAIARQKIGHIGDEVYVDGEYVMAKITIDHPDGLAAIQAGKNQLSCGYRLNVVEEAGVFNGMRYTHVQKDIEGDHLCITTTARLGPELRLDSADAIEVQGDNQQPPKERSMKFNIDGIEYDAAPEVVNFAKREKDRADKAEAKTAEVQGKLDTANTEKTQIQAKADGLKADLDKAKSDFADLEKNIPARAAALAKDRAAVDAVAKTLIKGDALKALDAMDIQGVKFAVVKARYPKMAVLDSKKDDVAYVGTLFDGIAEEAKSKKPAAADAHANNRSDSAPVTAEDTEVEGDMETALEKARDAADKRATEAWKKPQVNAVA